ncbi:MAG TPA: hypothetical protein VF454_03905 [Gemmatimonadales bacterium]
MKQGAALGLTLLLVACAAGGLGAPPGQAALAPADEAELKTLAVRGMREELRRIGANSPAGLLVFLDTLVGPTPEEFVYDWVHRREWLVAMRTTHLVDELYGPRAERDRLEPRSIADELHAPRGIQDRSARLAIVVEVGAPFPLGRDTLAIIYDYCIRPVPSTDRAPGANISVWRDSFVRADTGWARVGHAPTVAPTGCTR